MFQEEISESKVVFIFSSPWNLNVAELLTLPGTNPEIDGVYVQVMMFLT